MRVLCVGGYFSNSESRTSGYFQKLAHFLGEALPVTNFTIVNGGTYDGLVALAHTFKDYDLIVWSADVPNDYPKVVNSIKQLNPKAMLVITKNNTGDKYSRKMLAARALAAKANLLIEFAKPTVGAITATVIDPLANAFIEKSTSIAQVAEVVVKRIIFLSSMTRVGSTEVATLGKVVTPEGMDAFFELTRAYAARFHTLIHADDNGRMLGNISFRCESGFPSMRHGNIMLVSKRNVDKRDIGLEAMVPVSLLESDGSPVIYASNFKPSVDTPIQRALYKHWPHAVFMLHAHVYIEGAPYTETMIPCGALEEVDEILRVIPDYDGSTLQYINLIGHGSIAIAPAVELLKDIPYIERVIS